MRLEDSMTLNRREFLQASAMAGGAVGFGLPGKPGSPSTVFDRPARHPLRILILGGTTFLGPHLIRYALGRGHSISTFTRGRTEPTIHKRLFDEVEELTGDRDTDLSALQGRTWDAVIDNSGQRVEWARSAAQLLKDSVDLYVYTSSTGVYLPYLGDDITEDTEVLLEDPPSDQPRDRPSYGVMKSLSELEVRRAFGDDRAIVVRPTYIVGPADPTNRFPYWPVRLEQGGEVLVPGRGHDSVQYIDVRDLTEFMVRCIENRTGGTFNLAGPTSRMGMHAFVHGVHGCVSSPVTWVMATDYDFLQEHEYRFSIPWLMPIGDYHGSARINIERAKNAGLTFRPLARTTLDTLEWWHSDAVSDERRERAWSGAQGGFAMSMEREREIIAAWRRRA
jgi:2'-hydroxyisoflavone reductase